MAELQAFTTDKKGNTIKRTPRSKDFAFILYPNEDAHHKLILEHITTLPLVLEAFAYIVHDDAHESVLVTTPEGDEEVASELKNQVKEHFHVLVRFREYSTVSGVRKYFNDYLHYIQVVNNVSGYLQYMTHTDFTSLCEGKTVYSADKIVSSAGFNKYLTQNYNFVSNFLTAYDLLVRQKLTFSDMINFLQTDMTDASFELFMRDFSRWQYFFIQLKKGFID